MSRAFVKETDESAPLPDRQISPHRNLVTRRGLRLMEEEFARYQGDLARATAAADREAIGRAGRELRYWTARLATAEVVEPGPEAERVVFGTTVTVGRGDGTEATFEIVGEDEADPGAGRIAWTAPVAQALLGSQPGEVRALPTGEVEGRGRGSERRASLGCRGALIRPSPSSRNDRWGVRASRGRRLRRSPEARGRG
jgi:transcription elongation GreA/GreB family factor